MKMSIGNTQKMSLSFGRMMFAIVLMAILILGIQGRGAATTVVEDESNAEIVEQETDVLQKRIDIKLIGVSQYEVTELFNDLLIGIPGVVEAKRFLLRIEPGRPQLCMVVWQVKIDDIEPFQLESNLYQKIRAVAEDSGDMDALDLTFSPTLENLELLKNIKPLRATTRELEFVLYCPTNSTKSNTNRGTLHRWPDSGFE